MKNHNTQGSLSSFFLIFSWKVIFSYNLGKGTEEEGGVWGWELEFYATLDDLHLSLWFWRHTHTNLSQWSWGNLEALGGSGCHAAETDNTSSVVGHSRSSKGVWGGDLRAQINSLYEGWADGGGRRVLGSEGLFIVWFLPTPAYLEAHKLFKLHSINLAPGLYLPELIWHNLTHIF